MKTGILILARCGSTRLAQKHLQPVNGRPILRYLLERINHEFRQEIVRGEVVVVLTTSDEPQNRAIEVVVGDLARLFYGSVHNIPLRELQAAEALGLDYVISVDGDDILCSAAGMRSVLESLRAGGAYVVTNGLPFGMNSFGYTHEFLKKSLSRSNHEVLETGWGRIFDKTVARTVAFAGFPQDERLRFTLDYPEDLEFFKGLLTELGADSVHCSDRRIVDTVMAREIFHNAAIARQYWENFHAQVKKEQETQPIRPRPSSGVALWDKAKKIIPGGGQLLSKRAERFLPGLWPSYYQRAKGCEVWDLDGNHYYDFAQMGVGSCILGYADEDVNQAVIRAVQDGSMCTLNCPEEVQLAERLCGLHPWAQMVRFARTGGEACAIAVRIARAASGRNGVAFCGYHGWHDWYLSANIAGTTNLDGQLLPGLEPAGVPRELRGTAVPFHYNDLSGLERVVRENDGKIGVIIMEPERGTSPAPGFLEGVRAVATRIGAVLIFDEVTSGFRMNVGGIHLLRGVQPDLAVLGKALGNGFPIAAIIGRQNVMDYAQSSFISSTFWTERIGFVAALATLAKMERLKVQRDLIRYGDQISEGWRHLSARYSIGVEITGIPPLTHIAFKMDDPLAVQTLYAQEMLRSGFLLGASVYTTHVFSEEIIEEFLKQSGSAFQKIRDAQDSGNLRSALHGAIIQSGFKRLT